MNLCIPVETDQGLDSRVCAHFGSAPKFCIVDTDTMETRTIANANQNHAHGMCQPVQALAGEKIDGIVVGGIGRGALMKLNAAGLQVFRTPYATAKETLDAFKTGTLEVFSADHVCGGHGHGGGCGSH